MTTFISEELLVPEDTEKRVTFWHVPKVTRLSFVSHLERSTHGCGDAFATLKQAV